MHRPNADKVDWKWRREREEKYFTNLSYEACPKSKVIKVLNMYNIFNLQNDTVSELPVHNFIFQHIHRHCPYTY
jgi:hypothetical protein